MFSTTLRSDFVQDPKGNNKKKLMTYKSFLTHIYITNILHNSFIPKVYVLHVEEQFWSNFCALNITTNLLEWSPFLLEFAKKSIQPQYSLQASSPVHLSKGCGYKLITTTIAG